MSENQEQPEEINWQEEIDKGRIDGTYEPIIRYCYERKLNPAIAIHEAGVHLARRGKNRKIRVPTYNVEGQFNGYQDIPFEEQDNKTKKNAFGARKIEGFGLESLPRSEQPIKNILLLEGASDYLTGRHLFRNDNSWLVVSCLGVGGALKAARACMAHPRCQDATLHILQDGDIPGDNAAEKVGIDWEWNVRILRPMKGCDLSDVWMHRTADITPPPPHEESPTLEGEYSEKLNEVAEGLIADYFTDFPDKTVTTVPFLTHDNVEKSVRIDTRKDADDLRAEVLIGRALQSKKSKPAVLGEESGFASLYESGAYEDQPPNEEGIIFTPPPSEFEIPQDEYYGEEDTGVFYTRPQEDGKASLPDDYKTPEEKESERRRKIAQRLAEVADTPLNCKDLSDFSSEFWYPPFDKDYVLAKIKNIAGEAVVSPMAVLASGLARISGAMAHDWKILSNKKLSPLNLFVCLTADSGTGKSAGYGVAKRFVIMNDHTADTTSYSEECPDDFKFIPHQVRGAPSSGEAIMGQLEDEVTLETDAGQPRVTKIQTRFRCMYVYDEMRGLVTLMERSGNTLKELFRQAWTGEDLSNLLANRSNSRFVEAGRSSIGMVAASQLELSAELIANRDEGDMQRWLWIPANTRDTSYSTQWPRRPIKVQPWRLTPRENEFCEINVEKYIEEEQALTQRVNLHGDVLPESLRTELINIGYLYNKHCSLMRMRIAALVAALCGQEPYVTRELYDWAGSLMNISHRTCLILEEEERLRRREVAIVERKKKGDDAAHIQIRTSDATLEESSILIERASMILSRRAIKLNAKGTDLTYTALSSGVSSHHINKWKALTQGDKRSLVETALTKAVEDGYLDIVDSDKYSLGQKTPA